MPFIVIKKPGNKVKIKIKTKTENQYQKEITTAALQLRVMLCALRVVWGALGCCKGRNGICGSG
jgi:hypothetical protein